MKIPEGLLWWRKEPGGAAWLAKLPGIVADCAEAWSLRVHEPFEPAHSSLVLPAERADGTHAVLKVNFPDSESECEPDSLADWRGRGAVLLLERDDERRSLLVERCQPGDQLWSVADEDQAGEIAAGVLGRLWRAPPAEHRYRFLADEAARWATELAERWSLLGGPFDRALLDAAVSACHELGPAQGSAVILHQDFHGGNVLRAERELWLAIDPKPLVGEREFDGASLLRDRRWLVGQADAGRRVARRLDVLAAVLDLDRERMRGWGIVHALAWGVSADKLETDMIECARLLLAA
jgi:streptomycin 6-kinase